LRTGPVSLLYDSRVGGGRIADSFPIKIFGAILRQSRRQDVFPESKRLSGLDKTQRMAERKRASEKERVRGGSDWYLGKLEGGKENAFGAPAEGARYGKTIYRKSHYVRGENNKRPVRLQALGVRGITSKRTHLVIGGEPITVEGKDSQCRT